MTSRDRLPSLPVVVSIGFALFLVVGTLAVGFVSISQILPVSSTNTTAVTPDPISSEAVSDLPPGYQRTGVSEAKVIAVHERELAGHEYEYQSRTVIPHARDETASLYVHSNRSARGTAVVIENGAYQNRSLTVSPTHVVRVYNETGVKIAEYANREFATGAPEVRTLLSKGAITLHDTEKTATGRLFYYEVHSNSIALGGMTVSEDGLIRRVWYQSDGGNRTTSVSIRYTNSN